MNYDKPLAAAALGVISTIPYEITTRVLLLMGIGEYSFYELDSLIVTTNRPSIFLGFIVSSVVGGVLAVFLYYATKKDWYRLFGAKKYCNQPNIRNSS